MTDSPPPGPASLSADDAILILEEADLASSAGVPLAPGLRAMAAEARPGRFRNSLTQLADRLEAGEPLPAVLGSLRPALSPVMESLIEGGIDSGRMDLILHWSAEQGRRHRSLQTQLWTALAYPFFLIAVASAIVSFVLFAIVPKFESIFRDFGTQLPPLTIFVVWLSRIVSNYWLVELAAASVLGVLALLFIFGSGRFSRQWGWGMIPLLGPLFRLMAVADFCQFLAILVELRSPLPKAVRLAGRASGDKWLMTAGEDLASAIEAGNLTAATSADLKFPIAIGQMLSSISDPDSLAEALHGLAEIYAARAEVNCRYISVVVEPLVMAVTTVGLGTIIVAILVPLVRLLSDLS